MTKNTTKFLFSLLAGILLLTNVYSQRGDMFISQHMLHTPFTNSAAMGMKPHFNGAIFYKSQILGIEGAPSIQALNVNAPIMDGRSHVGFSLNNDMIGPNMYSKILGSYAYTIEAFNNNYLSFGISAGVDLLQNKRAGIPVNDELDPIFANNSKMFVLPNFNLGIFYFTRKYFVGIGVNEILSTDIVTTDGFKSELDFDLAEIPFNMQAGYTFELNENFDLKTYLFAKKIEPGFYQADLTVITEFNKMVGVGFSYRTPGALNIISTLNISDIFKLGYAFDYNFSDIRSVTAGSHELMLIFNLKKEKQNAIIDSPRY
ncbi:MAG: PorP/SprF family type IX secretion system membrane protein [bacterium]